MKLKKIASLALAGVMAVSMLTACNTASNGNTNDNDDVIVNPAPTSIVTAVNNGQSATNKVKIDFTSDASLDAALSSAVKSVGDIGLRPEMVALMQELTGEKVGINEVDQKTGWKKDIINGVITRGWKLDTSVDGKVVTDMEVMYIPGLTEEAALKRAADAIDSVVATLVDTTYNMVEADEKYTDYSYTGTVSMVSAQTVAGTTNYYVAYTITQTTSVKTLAPQA